MQIRLDKYLADMGFGTRSQVKQYIRKKQVLVNGRIPKGPEQKVNLTDAVSFQGKNISWQEYEYFMFYKPGGCVSAVKDNYHKTVLDYFPANRRKDLFPVGRLDIDTEGLLLITNDGALAHNLLAPGKHVPKTYFARVSGRVTEEDAQIFARGVDIGEKALTLPAKMKILPAEPGEKAPAFSAGRKILSEEPEVSAVELTITEGKFHQVKRMFEAVGKEVLYLKRISMGELKLDESLQPGEYRSLTQEELERLKASGTKEVFTTGQTSGFELDSLNTDTGSRENA